MSLACLASRGLQAADPGPAAWRVLLLSGGDPNLPGVIAQGQSMRATLYGAPRPVEFRNEYLDAVSFDLPDYETELLALLRAKHRGVRFDLVVPTGDVALSFVERHRAELWPDAPVVFYSVGPEEVRRRTLAPGITGVTIDFDLRGTVDLAARLQPTARRIFVVGGSANYDRWWVSPLTDAVRRRGLEPVLLLDRTLADLLRELATVPPDAIVIYTSLSRDAAGQPFVPANLVEPIAKASRAPVYGFVETYVGRGIVGGSISSFEAQGRAAGALALRVLSGERPETIPVQPAPPFTAMVDWRALTARGLSARLLPADAVLVNRPPSIWREYRYHVLGAALVLGIQTALLAGLLVQRRRRRLAESEAQRQRAELAHALRLSVVGELTASIAHEINQPLGAILSYAEAAELLTQDQPGSERLRRILGQIRNEDLRACDVIQHVRAMAHKGPPEMASLDLNALAEDVLRLVSPDARRRSVALDVDLAPVLPPVNGDLRQLEQVVLNLLLNAMEAMADTPSPGRRMRLATSRENGGVRLTVADAGPGIEPESLPRLFDSFFTTKKDGMGLGLSIARSIVDAHGGRIWAENDAGGGAIFHVLLPASGAPEGPATRV